MQSPKPVAFLDYQVLDHMQRIDAGTYKGASGPELKALRQAAKAGHVEIWMSRITSVEMMIGLEKPNLAPDKRAKACINDTDKQAIAKSMRVQWLTYPASKTSDIYSRTDLTFMTADEDCGRANALEEELLKLPGVSAGDARQVVSCVFGRAEKDWRRPAIRWFVSEDRALREALDHVKASGNVDAFAELEVRSVKDFVGHGKAKGWW